MNQTSGATEGVAELRAGIATIDGVADHLLGVVKAAEKAAAGIVEEARVQARRDAGAARREAEGIVADQTRRVAGLCDGPTRQAEAVKRQADELVKLLEIGTERLEAAAAQERR